MFGKLRLIGRGARAPEDSRAGGKSAPAGRAPAATQANTPDLEKVAAPKVLAAWALTNRASWRNAVPRPLITELQPPKGAATWDQSARG
jgi:hypothetical protein